MNSENIIYAITCIYMYYTKDDEYGHRNLQDYEREAIVAVYKDRDIANTKAKEFTENLCNELNNRCYQPNRAKYNKEFEHNYYNLYSYYRDDTTCYDERYENFIINVKVNEIFLDKI